MFPLLNIPHREHLRESDAEPSWRFYAPAESHQNSCIHLLGLPWNGWWNLLLAVEPFQPGSGEQQSYFFNIQALQVGNGFSRITKKKKDQAKGPLIPTWHGAGAVILQVMGNPHGLKARIPHHRQQTGCSESQEHSIYIKLCVWTGTETVTAP